MESNFFSNILHYEPFKRLILNYLWFNDILQLSLVSKEISSLIQEDSWISKELLNRILSKSHRKVDFISPYLVPCFSFSKSLQLSARLTQWPNDVFFPTEKVVYHIIEMNDVPGSHGKCFCYQGRILGRNRSIVANDHFPVPIPSPEMEDWVQKFRPTCSLPFTKIVTDIGSLKAFPVLSYIAYFEISIFDPRPPKNILMSRVDSAPCICIGISRPGFDIQSRMPGWDKNSYGYHGDDGCFFVGNSFNGFPTGNENSNTFGPGDTVGFGIVYPSSLNIDNEDLRNEVQESGMLFCTKNGSLCYCHKIQDSNFFKFSWFPTIGTDCYYPVEFNFGGKAKPFAFDIVSFEHSITYDWKIPRPDFLPSTAIHRFNIPECRDKVEFQETLIRINSILDDYDFHHAIKFIYPPFNDFYIPWRVVDTEPFDGLQFFHDDFTISSKRQAQGYYDKQFQIPEDQLLEIISGLQNNPELISQLLQTLVENGNIEDFEDLEEIDEDDMEDEDEDDWEDIEDDQENEA